MVMNSYLLRNRVYPLKIAVQRLVQRKKYIIKRHLQYNLLVLSLSYALFFTFFVGAMLFIPLIVEFNGVEPFSSDAFSLAAEILYLHDTYWPTVLIPLFIIAVHSILTSHRVAGPLYRFSNIFRNIEQGSLPKPIQLRKRDFLKTEMAQINQMLTSLRERILVVQKLQDEFCSELTAFQRETARTLSEKELQRLNRFISKGKELEEKLAEFKIEA